MRHTPYRIPWVPRALRGRDGKGDPTAASLSDSVRRVVAYSGVEKIRCQRMLVRNGSGRTPSRS